MSLEHSVSVPVIQPGVRSFAVNLPPDRALWTDATMKKALYDQHGIPPGIQTLRMSPEGDSLELQLDMSGGCGVSCRLPCCGAGCGCNVPRRCVIQ